MTDPLAVSTFRSWQLRRAAKVRRHRHLEDVLTAASSQILFLLLFFHVRYGLLVPVLPGPTRLWVGRVLIAAVVTLDLALVLKPDKVLAVVRKALRGLLMSMTYAVTYPLLAALYIVSCPFSRVLGRRAYLLRHAPAAPWVTGGEWRVVSSWQPKVSEDVQANSGRRPILLRLLARVGSGGNVFLLLLALLVLLVASLNFLVYSPKLAPFIYTLF
jgi:hypothetical protein